MPSGLRGAGKRKEKAYLRVSQNGRRSGTSSCEKKIRRATPPKTPEEISALAQHVPWSKPGRKTGALPAGPDKARGGSWRDREGGEESHNEGAENLVSIETTEMWQGNPKPPTRRTYKRKGAL